MRLLQLKKNLLTKITLIFLVAGLISSCSKDKDNTPGTGYPKNVTIEYKVTSLTSGLNTLNITYTNETGATTDLKNQPLPFTKTVKRSVNYAANALLSIDAAVPGSAKLEIYVDGKLAITESPSSQQYLGGSIVHIFN